MYKLFYYLSLILGVITMILGFLICLLSMANDYDPGIAPGFLFGVGSFVFLFFILAINKIITVLENLQTK